MKNIFVTFIVTALIVIGINTLYTNRIVTKFVAAQKAAAPQPIKLSVRTKMELHWMKELIGMTMKQAAQQDGVSNFFSLDEQKELFKHLDIVGYTDYTFMEGFPLILKAKISGQFPGIYLIDSDGKEHGVWSISLLKYCGYKHLGDWGMSVADYASFE